MLDVMTATSNSAQTSALNVLVVEDDALLGKTVQKGLTEAGHSCTWVRSGGKGREIAESQQYDAIVLDLMLPDISGLDLLQKIREKGILTPIIITTALGSVTDRVRGLNLGADDYMVKPFEFAELLARLTAVSRRASHRPSSETKAGSLVLDLATRRVQRGGMEITLTPTEFSLLEYLIRYQGQVVTRKMLCEHLWDADWEGVTNVIEVHINRLRTKLNKGFDDPLIHTVRGRGYVLRAT
jgi:two-component system OmpR family response regulator